MGDCWIDFAEPGSSGATDFEVAGYLRWDGIMQLEIATGGWHGALCAPFAGMRLIAQRLRDGVPLLIEDPGGGTLRIDGAVGRRLGDTLDNFCAEFERTRLALAPAAGSA